MENPQQQQNIFNLKLYDLFIFPVSWLIFVIIGRVFFENGLGQYHSTHSKKWASLCKSLFLLSFVTCCTLLELVTFEILDLLHPALRLFFWTTSLAILAILLNVFIPAILAISIGFHKNYSVRFSIFLGCVSVCLFQLLMWVTGSLLHYYQNKYYSSTGGVFSNTGLNDLEDVDLSSIQSPSMMKWVFMFDRENSSNYDNNNPSMITPFFLMADIIFQFDIQQSIANIAVLGTICAAVISGFATVFFPLEQLLMFRGVDAEQLRRREYSLSHLLREIATRKKELLMISISSSPSSCDLNGTRTNSRITENNFIYPHQINTEKEKEKDFKDMRSEGIKRENSKNKSNSNYDSIDREDSPKEKMKNKNKAVTFDSIQNIQNIVGTCCATNQNLNYLHLNKNVTLLEELSSELFSEIVALKEQQQMAEAARTQWGRIMRLLGQILT